LTVDDAGPATALCRNCDATLAPAGHYCPHCGQRVAHARLSFHEISHDLLHALFHVDRSVISLLRVLIAYPGRVARDYVAGKRKRYFGPFALLVIVVALATAAIHLFDTQRLVLVPAAPNATTAFVQSFLIRHANLVFFIQVPLLAAACRALAVKDPLNYAEYLVLAAYASSVRILFYTIAIIPLKHMVADTSTTTVQLYVAYLTFWALYFGIAMAQFLGERRLLSIIKGIVAVVLAQVFASILLSAIAQAFLRLHS
jgi:uncharacterized protein DUF3667